MIHSLSARVFFEQHFVRFFLKKVFFLSSSSFFKKNKNTSLFIHVYAMVYRWKSEDNLWESILPFCHMGPRDQTLVVPLDGQCPGLLSCVQVLSVQLIVILFKLTKI